MPICDICSKQLERSEMQIFQGSRISSATAQGFVPRNLGAHSPMKELASLFGGTTTSNDEQWKFVVAQNQTADWGLCADCATELNRFAQTASKSKWGCLTVVALMAIALLIYGIWFRT